MLKHELLHSPRMHMPKHEAAAWFEVEDAETELSLRSEQMLRHSETATMLKHEPRQSAVKPTQSRGAIHVAETARELRC
jgi:hypothetical protein